MPFSLPSSLSFRSKLKWPILTVKRAISRRSHKKIGDCEQPKTKVPKVKILRWSWGGVEYGLDSLKWCLCFAWRNPETQLLGEDDSCHPTLYSLANNDSSLTVLIIKRFCGIFWKSIYDLAAVFFGSKEFMYIISMLYCVILTICL